jgi:four helix bundle protein
MQDTSGKLLTLDRRTASYAKTVRDYIDKLPKRITNIEIGKQLMRSAGSIGANYIEANESLSRKDFIYRMKVCRKEAKETWYWLELSSPTKEFEDAKMRLMCESIELIKIFSAIISKVTT